MCDFIFVGNSMVCPICHRFREIRSQIVHYLALSCRMGQGQIKYAFLTPIYDFLFIGSICSYLSSFIYHVWSSHILPISFLTFKLHHCHQLERHAWAFDFHLTLTHSITFFVILYHLCTIYISIFWHWNKTSIRY